MSLILTKTARWLVGLAVASTIGVSAYYGTSLFKSAQSSQPTAVANVPKITALGRLEPESEVVTVAAPLVLSGDRLEQILVQEGEPVQQGQIMAVLDSRTRLETALQQAQQQVWVAQAKLAQVEAGAKAGEIEAQQAEIARLRLELAGENQAQAATVARLRAEANNARTELDRFELLYQEGAIAASTLDSKRLAWQTAQSQLDEAQATKNRTVATLQAQLQEAQATLNGVAEVRPTDLHAAQAEVDSAIAALKQAKIDLEQASIRAPISGRVLKIHAHPGEKIDESGIADLGQTGQMIAVAEVYQTDIGKIEREQQATITGQAFSGELQGTVSQVGLQIERQNVFSNQPGENLDRRVVEVEIRLTPAASERVAGLTNLQVQVAIHL